MSHPNQLSFPFDSHTPADGSDQYPGSSSLAQTPDSNSDSNSTASDSASDSDNVDSDQEKSNASSLDAAQRQLLSLIGFNLYAETAVSKIRTYMLPPASRIEKSKQDADSERTSTPDDANYPRLPPLECIKHMVNLCIDPSIDPSTAAGALGILRSIVQFCDVREPANCTSSRRKAAGEIWAKFKLAFVPTQKEQIKRTVHSTAHVFVPSPTKKKRPRKRTDKKQSKDDQTDDRAQSQAHTQLNANYAEDAEKLAPAVSAIHRGIYIFKSVNSFWNFTGWGLSLASYSSEQLQALSARITDFFDFFSQVVSLDSHLCNAEECGDNETKAKDIVTYFLEDSLVDISWYVLASNVAEFTNPFAGSSGFSYPLPGLERKSISRVALNSLYTRSKWLDLVLTNCLPSQRASFGAKVSSNEYNQFFKWVRLVTYARRRLDWPAELPVCRIIRLAWISALSRSSRRLVIDELMKLGCWKWPIVPRQPLLSTLSVQGETVPQKSTPVWSSSARLAAATMAKITPHAMESADCYDMEAVNMLILDFLLLCLANKDSAPKIDIDKFKHEYSKCYVTDDPLVTLCIDVFLPTLYTSDQDVATTDGPKNEPVSNRDPKPISSKEAVPDVPPPQPTKAPVLPEKKSSLEPMSQFEAQPSPSPNKTQSILSHFEAHPSPSPKKTQSILSHFEAQPSPSPKKKTQSVISHFEAKPSSAPKKKTQPMKLYFHAQSNQSLIMPKKTAPRSPKSKSKDSTIDKHKEPLLLELSSDNYRTPTNTTPVKPPSQPILTNYATPAFADREVIDLCTPSPISRPKLTVECESPVIIELSSGTQSLSDTDDATLPLNQKVKLEPGSLFSKFKLAKGSSSAASSSQVSATTSSGHVLGPAPSSSGSNLSFHSANSHSRSPSA